MRTTAPKHTAAVAHVGQPPVMTMATDASSLSRRSISSDSLESFTSELSRAQSVAGDRPSGLTRSALYSTGSKHVSPFPPPAPPHSASTMDLRQNGKKAPKGLLGLAKKLQRKMSSTSASDLATDQGDSAISSADTSLSTSDLSDTFRLRMGTLNRRLHLKDSAKGYVASRSAVLCLPVTCMCHCA